MKKNLLLYIILGFLIIMNGFFLLEHYGASDNVGLQRRGLSHFIDNELGFDAKQLQKFEKLDRAHREKINTIRRDIMASRDVLFDKVFDESFDESKIEAMTEEIANMEKTKAFETFRFLRSVSEICNENQRERFKKIVKDGLHRQGPPDGNRRPYRSGREGRPSPPPRN